MRTTWAFTIAGGKISADDMIALRRDLMASALAPEDLATLNSLLQQVLTGIEDRNPRQPPR